MRFVTLRRSLFLALLLPLPLCVMASSASAVVIEWVTVGDPGNACETQAGGCFGAVGVTYRIAKTEVTNAQYVEFLNAVAATDPNALYATLMSVVSSGGGILRSGSVGTYTYSTIAGRENMAVIHASFYDALRFANWMHNGQPLGDQNGTTTESGAYSITALGITDNSITRNGDATIFVTSEDEWYKAAYYDPGSVSYFNYPAGANATTVCTSSGATPNTANCNNAVGNLEDVASYTGSASPYGTFDLCGSAYEWNEAVINTTLRGTRGGGHKNGVGSCAASNRNVLTGPAGSMGIRLASPASEPPAPPGPPIPALGSMAFALLGIVIGVAGVRRLRT